jgi:hypothetical protein
MAGFTVTLRVDFGRRPAMAELAFLGPLRATVERRAGEAVITVDVDAPDIGAALAGAGDLVLGPLPGRVMMATVAAHDGGGLLPPGRVRDKRLNPVPPRD